MAASDVALVQLASAQHGLVTSTQATDALGASRLSYWIRSGRLERPQPRVYRVAGSPATWHQALLAAQLSCDGIVSHRSAAELWGLVPSTGHVEVTVPTRRRAELYPPALVHRIGDIHPGLAVERAGIRVTDPQRTLVDLGLVCPQWQVERALVRALTSKLVAVSDVRHLREALGRPGRNGTGVIGRLLDIRELISAESVLESKFMALCRKHGLDPPTFQFEVWHQGRFVARLDAAYVDVKLAIELDGFSAHAGPSAFQRDRERQNELVALGWTVLRFTWADVTSTPADVVATIREARRRRSAA
jgi:very-short-patch-repair endonuclease